MPIEISPIFETPNDLLFFHFDVPDHYVRLATFIETAAQAEVIIQAFNTTFFNNELGYELVVVPPAAGTFLTKLALVIGLPGSVFAVANSTVGSAYIEGFTGKPASHWAKLAGEKSAEFLDDFDNWNEPQQLTKITAQERSAICKAETKVIVEMTKGVLSLNNSELNKVGMHFGSLPDALNARGAFYEACLHDPDIRAIGFNEEDDFPIRRNSFPERAIRTEKPKEQETIPWTVVTEAIVVTSPNWDQKDQFLRQWKGKDAAKRDCYFVISDEEFWHHAKYHDLKVDVYDRLKVQWAYQVLNHRIKNRRVLRVLEYNEVSLAKPLNDSAIRAILGEYDLESPTSGERSLFD